MRSFKEFLGHVKRLKFEPKTVIDVGVSYGTPEIFEAFPDAYYVFVEPLLELEGRMKVLIRRFRGEYHLCAAGRQETIAQFHVPKASDQSSLKFGRISDASRLRQVKVTPLDALIKGPLQRPVFLKTDCQGGDMDTIRGAAGLLDSTDLILMEVQMFRAAGIHRDNEFVNVIEEMHKRGFVPYDFVHYKTRPADEALGQINVGFVKENGGFRRNHHWDGEKTDFLPDSAGSGE
jgi:FkbM family methyltransferase